MKINKIINEFKENADLILAQMDEKGLKQVINYLDDHYYNKGESLLSDQLYDYVKTHYNNIYKKQDQKIDEIGYKVIKNEVVLPYYMGSLDKIKPSKNKFDLWIKKYVGEYIVSYKLDGISSLLYKTDNGVYLYTRGNGYIGQDITHVLKYININTQKLKIGDAIRGELIMSKDNFEIFKKQIQKETVEEIKNETLKKIENEIKKNKKNNDNFNLSKDKKDEIKKLVTEKIGEKMKNSRTAVGGLINNKKPNPDKLKYIDFVAYDVMSMNTKYSEKIKYLKTLDILIVQYYIIKDLTLKYLSEKLLHTREHYKYVIDGLVVFDDSIAHIIIPGQKPKYAFAFKQMMTDQLAESTVTSVVWNVSKDKYLKPTILIEPIELLDSKISKMTGVNAKFIQDNKIGPGAVVEIVKSGDVIPNINKIIKPADNNQGQMPKHDYTWNDTKIDIILSKMSDDLMNKIISKKLQYFFEKLKIKYVGEGIINKFIKYGYDDLWKILIAKDKKDDLNKLNGFNKKLTDKIYDEIDKGLSNVKLYEIMSASQVLGRGIGSKKFKLITDAYPNIIEIYKNNDKIYVSNIIKSILGFNTKTADKIVDNFDSFIDFYNKLVKLKPNIIEIKNKNKKSKYNLEQFINKKIVFTGIRDKEIEEEIENIGGKISTSVSSNTNYVIAKDINSNSGSIKKAQKLNIPILLIDEFYTLIGK
jgi:DNA ligase (NAD+)